jgi:DNA-binding MarR family transcriptional regulator
VVPAHGAVFACLFQAGEPVPIKEVVVHVGRVKSTVTGVLKHLERGGYLTRETSGADRRVQLVSLTDKGWALREDFEAISEILQHRLYAEMPETERRKLVALLGRLERNLGAGPDEEGS